MVLAAACIEWPPCHSNLGNDDSFDTDNSRPIAVTEPIMCLYAHILNARVVKYAEEDSSRAEAQRRLQACFGNTSQALCSAISHK